MYIIKVSADFAVGAVWDTEEAAQKAAERMGLKNFTVEFQPVS